MSKTLSKYLVVIFLFMPSVSFAYEPTTTHAGLSQEIVDFYNYFSYPKITDDEKELIIYGSIEEDNPPERALNHFYDPIRNIGFNEYPSAKQWASGEILNNSHSWQNAIDAYARGDEEVAFVDLGHTIHLIEDVGVPDHTRNDPHKGDGLGGLFTNESPFEKWGDQNKNREKMKYLYFDFIKEGLTPQKLNTLNEYFDFLAKYSNENFFSKDTIEGKTFKYSKPTIQDIDGKYGYWNDVLTGNKSKLLISVKDKKGVVINALTIDGDRSVLSEYFDRLSRQIVPTGAGVIELFFKEAKLAREEYQKEQAELQAKEDERNKEIVNAYNNYLSGGIFDKAKYVIQYTWDYNVKKGMFAVTKRLRQIAKQPIELAQRGSFLGKALGFTGNNLTKLAAIKTKENVDKGVEETKNAISFIQKNNKPFTLAVGPGLAFLNKPTTNDLRLTTDDLQSTTNNSQPTTNDQQSIALAPTPAPIQNLFPVGAGGFGGGGAPINQQPTTNDQQSEIAISTTTEEVATTTPEEPEEIIPDTTPPDVTGSIAECAYSLVLGSCVIATSTANLSWFSTATDTVFYQISLNDVLSSTSTATEAEINLGEGIHLIKVLAYDTAGNIGTSSELTIEYIKMPLVISEIAWAGTETSANNEWLEIYNRSSHTISLSNIFIKALDGTPEIALERNIFPSSYFLVERTDDKSVPFIAADMKVAFSGVGEGSGLQNGGEQLQLIHTMGDVFVTVDLTPATTSCAGWCFGNTSSFATMARSSLDSPGSEVDSWAKDEYFNEDIFDDSGEVIIGTPKAPYVFVPEIITPF